MTAIAIFVKTPGLSPVKTRLAGEIGRSRAERWHALAAQAVAELARTASIGPVYFAVAETEALDHALWSGLPVLDQGRGGLGRRMHAIHTTLVEQHGSALLLGADAIQWRPDWLSRASEWLNGSEPRWVIGPASDGGFWTVGANRPLAERYWTEVRYSRADTCERFLSKLADSGHGLTLPTLTDLDELSDRPAVLKEISEHSVTSPALARATDYLASNFAE